jgi:tRNA(Ile)-lysidine synthase
MASSRKPRNAELAVGLSGGVDSVVLLHRLSRDFPGIRAIHVHHGLSPNADAWAKFCARLCRQWKVPLSIHRVAVKKKGQGLEAAAREARYAAFLASPAKAIVLAHHLDDQAETVLMNLLRGAGTRGASGMAAQSRRGGKTFVRPLLAVPRKAILSYARKHKLDWIEDESNTDEALTRNFIRRRIGPLLEKKYPRWKEALSRAAKHFSRKEAGREDLLRGFLRSKGMKAPSEAKLAEMLKQLGGKGARVVHDGKVLRHYRGAVHVDEEQATREFKPASWSGRSVLTIPALGGELRARRAKGRGIAAAHFPLAVRLRSGGERLRPDPKRPRRTLKNLFQEAGVPPWKRERLPLLFSGAELVWAPGLGVDIRFRAGSGAKGVLPDWRARS